MEEVIKSVNTEDITMVAFDFDSCILFYKDNEVVARLLYYYDSFKELYTYSIYIEFLAVFFPNTIFHLTNDIFYKAVRKLKPRECWNYNLVLYLAQGHDIK